MSKIYEKESQLIVRFPAEIAAKLREYFETSRKTALETRLFSEINGGTATIVSQSSSSDKADAQLMQANQAASAAAAAATLAASNPGQAAPAPCIAPSIVFQPRIIKDEETGASRLSFEIQVDDFKSKGSLIDLPCTLETYKTEDTINIFKSNDMKQMIYIHPDESSEVPDNLAKKSVVFDPETNENVVKFESHHGLTPPTHYIRKQFYRKKPILLKEDVQEVEKMMVKIQKEIAKNDKEPERPKRKYKKRY